MNKKEKFDKKIEIMKQFLEANGSIEALVEAQNEILCSTVSDNAGKHAKTDSKNDKEQ